MVSPTTKRRAVQMSVENGLGRTAQACRALGLARSSYYRPRQLNATQRQVHARIVQLSEQHPRYGYRRITALLRRAGCQVNAKRVQRLRREYGLQTRKKQRRMKRVGESTAQRRRASRPNEVWSWDFVHDQTEHGSRFRILTLIDEYTRESLATHAHWSIRASDVIRVVVAAMQRHGRPEHLRSDNGPEFIAYAIQDWLRNERIETIYIKPGSPWENAYIESFHDKLRDECLNREIFGSLHEARVIIEAWRREYNELRPHSALSYQTPSEFALSLHAGLRSGCALPTPSMANPETNIQRRPLV